MFHASVTARNATMVVGGILFGGIHPKMVDPTSFNRYLSNTGTTSDGLWQTVIDKLNEFGVEAIFTCYKNQLLKL